MVYLRQGDLTYRSMKETDVAILFHSFYALGWNKPREQFTAYFNDNLTGARKTIIFEKGGILAGYVNLLPSPGAGPFAGSLYPEVHDFNVLPAFRRKGIGNTAMDVVEQLASEVGDVITLAVGLYTDYGTAQRMYVKRGYVPDGSGVWYQHKNLRPGAPCVNDDDLVLYLSKKLR